MGRVWVGLAAFSRTRLHAPVAARVSVRPAADAAIIMQAGGVVSGSVPEANWTGQSQSYPPYSYTDLIGGTGSLAF